MRKMICNTVAYLRQLVLAVLIHYNHVIKMMSELRNEEIGIPAILEPLDTV